MIKIEMLSSFDFNKLIHLIIHFTRGVDKEIGLVVPVHVILVQIACLLMMKKVIMMDRMFTSLCLVLF